MPDLRASDGGSSRKRLQQVRLSACADAGRRGSLAANRPRRHALGERELAGRKSSLLICYWEGELALLATLMKAVSATGTGEESWRDPIYSAAPAA